LTNCARSGTSCIGPKIDFAWTVRERDEARREAEARQADLGVEVARRLDAEGVSAGLCTDLAEARGLL